MPEVSMRQSQNTVQTKQFKEGEINEKENF